MEDLEELLRVSDVAMDHARNPRNLGPLTSFNGYARITGPCGDTMEFWLYVRNDRVLRVSFNTDGCGSSLACGSMTTCLAEGKSLMDATRLSKQDILAALGDFPRDSHHCALLASEVLRAACEDYRLHGKWKAP